MSSQLLGGHQPDSRGARSHTKEIAQKGIFGGTKDN